MDPPHQLRRALYAAAWLLLLGMGLWLRLPVISERPLHVDEAVQGMIFVDLLEAGEYAYNPRHFHGPSLYFLTLPAAWLEGAGDRSELSGATLRLVPMAFSLLLALVPFLLYRELGKRGVLVASGFLLFSPGLVYYSTYYIQEMLLVAAFTAYAALLWRYWNGPGRLRAGGLGLAAGLMLASKESALFYMGAALVSLLAGVRVPLGARYPVPPVPPRWRLHLALALSAAGCLYLLFFSSFGTHLPGLWDGLRGIFLHQPEPGHEKPWWYYLAILAGFTRGLPLLAGEGFLLPLAISGGLLLVLGGRLGIRIRCGIYFLSMAFLLLSGLSLFPYKTPWLLLTVIPMLAVVFGLGVERTWKRIGPHPARYGVVALVVLALGLSFREAVWTTRVFPADARNPYAYVHTSWDAPELAGRILDLAADAQRPVVKIMGEEYWPLPWYLRTLDRVGYWNRLPEDPYAPVMVVGAEWADQLDAERMAGYVAEIRGLRPGRLVLLYVERDLWERRILGHAGASSP